MREHGAAHICRLEVPMYVFTVSETLLFAALCIMLFTAVILLFRRSVTR